MQRELTKERVRLERALASEGEARRAAEAIRGLGNGRWRPVILVGGRLFLESRELSRRVGADVAAESAEEAVVLLGERFR